MSFVTYARTASIGTLTMSRPPANSYEIEFMRALDAAIDAAERDAECRVVLVRSAVAGFFCGGADIKRFRANSPAANMELIACAHQTLSRPARSEKVYVAEIGGHALGGGFEIALACDLRFAARGKFRIGLPEVTLGLLPGNGGTQRLAALVGPSKALELMITGAALGPEEAHALGLVNRLSAPESLGEETRRFAESLAEGATLAIGKIKRSVYDGHCQGLESGLAVERSNIATLFASTDAIEGFTAFIERRAAQFTGR